MNSQIKKNGISFDIDFENIKQDIITTKNNPKIKSLKKQKLYQMKKTQMKQIKNKFYINVQIVLGNSKEKHMQNMFLFVKEFSKEKKRQKILN